MSTGTGAQDAALVAQVSSFLHLIRTFADCALRPQLKAQQLQIQMLMAAQQYGQYGADVSLLHSDPRIEHLLIISSV